MADVFRYISGCYRSMANHDYGHSCICGELLSSIRILRILPTRLFGVSRLATGKIMDDVIGSRLSHLTWTRLVS